MEDARRHKTNNLVYKKQGLDGVTLLGTLKTDNDKIALFPNNHTILTLVGYTIE